MKPLLTFFSQHRTYLLILTGLVFAAYLPTLNHEFISDDLPTIVNNPQITSFSYVWNDITFVTRAFFLWFMASAFGVNPIAFRLLNVMFHLGVTLLSYELATSLKNKRVGLITASLVAVHPIMIESVTWISGGIYAQYTFFLLLSLLLYRHRYLKTSLLVYIFTLTTSEKAVVFPLILLIYEYTTSQSQLKGVLLHHWKRLTTFFVLALLFSILKLSQLTQRASDISNAAGEVLYHNPLQQIPVALSSYIQLMLWPFRLTIYHTEFSLNATQYIGHVVIFILLLFTLFHTWRTQQRFSLFGLLLFVIALMPTLTPLGIAWVVAERYVYFGAIGAFFVAGLLIDRWITNKQSLFVFLGVIIFLLFIRTTIRNADWKTRDTFWIATAEASPTSPNAFNNLGDVYVRQGNLPAAHEAFMKAIEIRPTYADAYHNVGNVLQASGNLEEALTAFDYAVQYKPSLWQSHQNRASILFTMGKYEDALTSIDNAIALQENPTLYTNKGIILLKMGNTEEGIHSLKIALSLNPEDQKAQALITEALQE